MSAMSTLVSRATKAKEKREKFQAAPKLTPAQKKTARNQAKRRRQGR